MIFRNFKIIYLKSKEYSHNKEMAVHRLRKTLAEAVKESTFEKVFNKE